MGLTLDKSRATERFAEALALARSTGKLPKEWIERTERVGSAKSATFTPVLGTALLAKATDDAVDALSLREDESHKGYSARSLAKEVLVPCCVRAGISIRNTGAEPLNNQPFLRAARITKDLKVKAGAVVDLAYLVESVQRADFLRGEAALQALAAFLRARIAASQKHAGRSLAGQTVPLRGLQERLTRLMAGDPEGGKVGQAVAAAILDIAFAKVVTKRINDPSNRWPGDVGAFNGKTQVMSAEVKQRPFSNEEIVQFAERLSTAGIRRGFVLAFRQGTQPLNAEKISAEPALRYGVELWFWFDSTTLLADSLCFSSADLTEAIELLPRSILARLEELEVSGPRADEWAAMFADK